MWKLISSIQFAFIPRRWIAKNGILAQDIVHLSLKRRGAKGMMGIKLDMQKAYDVVKWGFVI